MTYVGFRLGVDLASPNLADPDLAPPALLTLEKGTFSRSSEAYALGSDSLLDQYAANELRTEYRSDLGLYLLEGERTNLSPNSEDVSVWVGGTATVAANTDVAPDGNTTADTITDDNASGFQGKTQDVSLTSGVTYTATFWVKKDSDESRFPEFLLAGGDALDWRIQLNTATGATTARTGSPKVEVIQIGDYWHVSITETFSTTATYTFGVFPAVTTTFGNAESSATGSVVVWGTMLEDAAAFPSSYIKTTTGSAVRQSDSLTFASGDIPGRVLSGKFTQQFRPYAASSDLVSGDEQWLLSVGGGNDGIRIRHDGTNVLLEYGRGGAVITASTALTYSRHQLMSYTLDHSTGDLTVSGATFGDGTTTGTSGSWTAATMRVGGVQAGANEAFMGLGNLEKAA